jgi:hypothetical protein
VTLYIGDCIASLERIPAEVERLASDLIELSTRYNFAFWLPGANVLRGWARNATGDKVEGAVRNDPAFVFPSSSAWKRANDAWEVIAFLEAEPVDAAELRSISPDAGSVRTRPCKNKASHR